MNMQEIGTRISTLRKRQDMTQLELADKMGVSYQAVSSWERGLTMPDIAKLSDISQALNVSIDELLGDGRQTEIVKNVLSEQTDVYSDGNELHIDDVAEVAPILKPSQVDALAKKAKPVSLGDLAGIAPFVSREVLEEFAAKAEEADDMDDLHGIAPFLGREYLDKLAVRIGSVKGIDALAGIAPFVSREALGQLVEKAEKAGDIESISGIAPFLGKEQLDKLARKVLARTE